MKIAITSDSTCSISQDEAKKYGIYVMPLNVIVNGKEFHDGIDITKEELALKMRANNKISTSTPTPIEIENFFNKVFADGYEQIIHFTISSKLSAMFDLFTLTCKNLYGDKVVVINSLAVCSFMGGHVLEALALRNKNLSVEKIVEKVSKRIGTEYVIFIPESLTYLKNGGRVSPTVALIGNFIGMKPILDFKNGEIGKKGTTRSLKKSLEDELVALKKNEYSPKLYEIHILTFDTAPATLEMTKGAIERNFPEFHVEVTPLSINVCAHTGPGTIGFGFTRKITV